MVTCVLDYFGRMAPCKFLLYEVKKKKKKDVIKLRAIWLIQVAANGAL